MLFTVVNSAWTASKVRVKRRTLHVSNLKLVHIGLALGLLQEYRIRLGFYCPGVRVRFWLG